ncbi:MAG: hypothetical protein WA766_12520 [Candidatus Acidiferrales bacterium]|jgi:hypothetical protein
MTLPETIAVRYTEDEAEYVSLRPVVRQTFQIDELLDMILSVTGKDATRVTQILRAGSVAFHGYRYWWTGFEAPGAELIAKLAKFPDADASRPFDSAACVAIVFESGGIPPRHSIEISRAVASRRRFFRLRSFWDDLNALVLAKPPAYRDYSYARHADVYISALAPEDAARLASAARRNLQRSLIASIKYLPEASRILWICPRSNSQ